MKIVISGSSGLIGSALVPALRTEGHEVLRLVRRASKSADEIGWDPGAGSIDRDRLKGVGGAINLSGAGVADHRWTKSYRKTILQSRLDCTGTLATALAELEPLPTVFLSGSASGYYGTTGARPATEADGPAEGFLANVCVQWEAATVSAEAAGIRTVHLRTGIVLSRKGGAIGRMRPIFRAGLGGRLGSGRQRWSWISMDDQVGAMIHLLTADTVRGPANLVAPSPNSNAEITKAVARALHRPAILPVPSLALKIVLGGFASEVLNDRGALPTVLQASGYRYRHPDIDSAVRAAL